MMMLRLWLCRRRRHGQLLVIDDTRRLQMHRRVLQGHDHRHMHDRFRTRRWALMARGPLRRERIPRGMLLLQLLMLLLMLMMVMVMVSTVEVGIDQVPFFCWSMDKGELSMNRLGSMQRVLVTVIIVVVGGGGGAALLQLIVQAQLGLLHAFLRFPWECVPEIAMFIDILDEHNLLQVRLIPLGDVGALDTPTIRDPAHDTRPTGQLFDQLKVLEFTVQGDFFLSTPFFVPSYHRGIRRFLFPRHFELTFLFQFAEFAEGRKLLTHRTGIAQGTHHGHDALVLQMMPTVVVKTVGVIDGIGIFEGIAT